MVDADLLFLQLADLVSRCIIKTALKAKWIYGAF